MHDVRESLIDRQIAVLALPCAKVRVQDVRVVDGAAKPGSWSPATSRYCSGM
jgi:hypothetical protein